MTKRSVFFLSDHTGITVEAMGRSLLSQFPALEYDTVHWPFIDTIEKAKRASWADQPGDNALRRSTAGLQYPGRSHLARLLP